MAYNSLYYKQMVEWLKLIGYGNLYIFYRNGYFGTFVTAIAITIKNIQIAISGLLLPHFLAEPEMK